MHTPFPTRKNIRLTGYDYSEEGLYFITICTHQRKHLFGKIIDGKISLNDFGNIAYQQWLSLPNHYQNVGLYDFVIMPNHIHGILVINYKNEQWIKDGRQMDGKARATARVAPTIGRIVGGYKSLVVNDCLKKYKNDLVIGKLWQRNYYEHIIRSDRELENICLYIQCNPVNWLLDSLIAKID